ncbi:sugar ABC transporter permease protein (plasmid) [Rhizobium gallicum]|uniref:Sugar ABC transporter permease protein n=2 Tax=Rhizobium TaxID=379 RepID=A0A1L5NRF2_9HYPH|nr:MULTISPECIES: ABC transporter permease [Rhizobium]APO70480.1 sugar ABC transporter permease protein [Rhizobium gallicum]TCU33568.1 monosaccharide ABC transporter membrane protein (CUT2 family) [Rhizobium azibense]
MLVDAALSPAANTTVTQPSRASAGRFSRRLTTLILRGGSLAVFAAVLIFFSVSAPYFLSVGNVGNVLAQSAIAGVLAVGLTVVIIAGGGNVVTGGIDLSLAANMGLSAAVYAALSQAGQGDAVAVAGALAAGLAIGAVNALAITVAGIIPLLATLAVMNIVAGLELVLTQNTVIPATGDLLTVLSGIGPFDVPALAYVLIGFAAIVALVVQATPLGLRLYAVGEFPEAARASGLSIRPFITGSFLFSGLCGGIAGILSVSYLSGSSTGAGELLLPVVVIALLGTVFSRRLVPTITGTLLSALFVGFLVNGFQLLNLSSTLVSGIQGVLILFVVSATTLLRKQETLA